MSKFIDYILTVLRGCGITMILWAGLLIVLFIVIGLIIGVAEVILGNSATILSKYTAILLIAAVLYQTFSYVTRDSSDDDEWKAPHECV